MADHFVLRGGALNTTTAAGAFVGKRLRLDRALHRSRRQARIDARTLLEGGRRALANPRPGADETELAAIQRELTRYEELLLVHPPHDAPTTCACRADELRNCE
jgi:hypothetical protein